MGCLKYFYNIDVHIENYILFSIVRGGSVSGVYQQRKKLGGLVMLLVTENGRSSIFKYKNVHN